MIEKFTPEELAIIKKELGVKDEPSSKEVIVANSLHKLRMHLKGTFDDKESPMSTKSHEVRTAIYNLVDLATENFVPGYSTNKYGNHTWRRTCYVPDDKRDLYKEAYAKMVDLFIDIHEKLKSGNTSYWIL